jgi:arylsulfatase A-like enzyme
MSTDSLHRLSEAVVIVTSDHGEELWEHGGYEHGHSLYQEVIAVPLIIEALGYLTPTDRP